MGRSWGRAWVRRLMMGACAAALSLAGPGPAISAAAKAPASRPWMNPRLSPDARAELVLARLSLDQQIALLHGHMPVFMGPKKPPGVVLSAGYLPGVPELGIPDLT
ncbi:MAG TPA: glycosyl hydrolase, partial [Phenylobacterium sp.]|nr:glycosyl hydrolase [Phenylobacterium sp.]